MRNMAVAIAWPLMLGYAGCLAGEQAAPSRAQSARAEVIRRLPPASQLHAVFAAEVAASDKEFEGKNLAAPNRNTWTVPFMPFTGWTTDSLWFAVPLSWARPEGVDPAPYREALIAALKDPNSEIRALACRVCGSAFDMDLVPHLAALLDDDAPGLPVGYSMAQSRSSLRSTGPVGVRTTVGDYAGDALSGILGVGFRSKAVYDRWAARQTNPKEKLWYWAALWTHAWSQNIAYLLQNRTGKPYGAFAPRLARLSHDFDPVPTGAALHILRQWRNPGALQEEAAHDAGLEGNSYPPQAYTTYGAPGSVLSPDDVADYYRRHGLRDRLIALLNDANLKERLKVDENMNLVAAAIPLGRRLFGPRDDAALAKAEWTAPWPMMSPTTEDVALLRADLNPHKAEQILESYLLKNLGANLVARELAERFGSAGAPALLAFYRGLQIGGERQETADCLLRAARRHITVKASFILDLARTDPPRKYPEHDEAVATLAEVANVSLRRDVVDPGYIEAVRHFRPFKQTREAQKARTRMRLAALEKVKSMLIAGLSPTE